MSLFNGSGSGTEGRSVKVHALSSIRNASSIQIEPILISDWELMEVYAQELEDGIILSQISVVYPGQIFSLSLGTNTVYVRVLNDGFSAITKESHHQIVNSCLRLVSDTEVIVAPKSRETNYTNKAFPSSGPIKVLPCETDFSTDMKKLHRICNSSPLIPSPPPFTAWMNPKALKDVPGWDSTSFSEVDSSFSPQSAHVLVKKTDSYGNATSDKDVALVELVSSEIVATNGIGEEFRYLLSAVQLN